MGMVPLKIAMVLWTDSTYYRIEQGLQEELPEFIQPRNLISVGLLLHEDENFICICQDLESTGVGSRLVLSIPKVSIISKEIFTKKIRVN